MGWFSDFIHNPVGTVLNTAKEIVTDPGKVLNDIVKTVDIAIIQPIKKDPITFIAATAAYVYGIPGLEVVGAGAGTGVAVGTATTASRLAQGDNFNDALKAGIISGAVTGAVNYGTNYYNQNFGTNAPGTAASVDRFGNSPGTTAFEGVSSPNAPVTGPDATGMAVKPLSFESTIVTDLPPANTSSAFNGGNGYTSNNTFTSGPNTTGLEMPSNITDTRFPTEQVTVNNPVQPGGVQMNAGQDSIYKSYVPAEPEYIPGSGSQPATGTPDRFVNDPNYPDLIDPITKRSPLQVRVEGTPGLPEVVDYSRVASPDTGALSLGNVGDAALAAGENAYSFAAAHPYYTAGGLLLASQALGGDKQQPAQSTGTPNAQVGDPRFYMSLPQLQMTRTYNPYEGDYSTYGQTGGTHKFLSDPVYEPIDYQAKEGGYVHMADGGYVGGGGLSPQLGAPQPQMMPQQPMPQGQQAPMPQQSPLAALGGAQANRGAMPQRPTGALQKVPMQQQNPNYRYFNYGAVPPSVQPTTPQSQTSQSYATGGLAMAHGGNVPDGRTDNIHAMLSPGEYVVDAETVALLGNGNGDAGAKRLDQMREAVRKQKGGALSKGKISPDAQSPLTYLSRRMA